MKFKDPQPFVFTTFIKQLSMAVATSILAQQLTYIITPANNKHKTSSSLFTMIAKNWHINRKPTEHAISIFGFKVVIDALTKTFDYDLSEYRKGSIVGLLTYIIGRPLD